MEILFQKKKEKGKDIFLLTYTIILRNILEGRAYIFKEKKKEISFHLTNGFIYSSDTEVSKKGRRLW